MGGVVNGDRGGPGKRVWQRPKIKAEGNHSACPKIREYPYQGRFIRVFVKNLS